jgi:hypothetical protein
VVNRSESQFEKQNSPIASTEEGRWIDVRPLPENADESICDNRDPNSNAMVVSEQQSAKHDSQINSIEAGTTIEIKPLP